MTKKGNNFKSQNGRFQSCKEGDKAGRSGEATYNAHCWKYFPSLEVRLDAERAFSGRERRRGRGGEEERQRRRGRGRGGGRVRDHNQPEYTNPGHVDFPFPIFSLSLSLLLLCSGSTPRSLSVFVFLFFKISEESVLIAENGQGGQEGQG